MAKVVKMPRNGAAKQALPVEMKGCAYIVEGREVYMECQGCQFSLDAPSERCMAGICSALDAHPEAIGLVLLGDEHVWIREREMETLRSLISAEKAWEGFRASIRSLPCFRPLPTEKVTRYIERVANGHADMFCLGEGRQCQECLKVQKDALGSLEGDWRRVRRTLAADRFRITEVAGGVEK
ncbi:MAG: hypothetical protein NT131_07890 [Methanomassiliicoccales archaeon]|nr:hypothetical protein [Methanomassiliicoccales archaeon]